MEELGGQIIDLESVNCLSMWGQLPACHHGMETQCSGEDLTSWKLIPLQIKAHASVTASFSFSPHANLQSAKHLGDPFLFFVDEEHVLQHDRTAFVAGVND